MIFCPSNDDLESVTAREEGRRAKLGPDDHLGTLQDPLSSMSDADVCKFSPGLGSAFPGPAHTHEHGAGGHSHSHDAAQEHGHTHEHLEHAGRVQVAWLPRLW